MLLANVSSVVREHWMGSSGSRAGSFVLGHTQDIVHVHRVSVPSDLHRVGVLVALQVGVGQQKLNMHQKRSRDQQYSKRHQQINFMFLQQTSGRTQLVRWCLRQLRRFKLRIGASQFPMLFEPYFKPS